MSLRVSTVLALCALAWGCPGRKSHVDAGTSDAGMDGSTPIDADATVAECTTSAPCPEGTCVDGRCLLGDYHVGSLQTGGRSTSGTTTAVITIGGQSISGGISTDAAGTVEHIGGFVASP